METALLILALASTHFFVGNLKTLRGLPRSKWLSFAGGVAVTYVLLHLLPELDKSRKAVEIKRIVHPALPPDLIYLCILVGFTAFYSLEKLASSMKDVKAGGRSKVIFYVHIAMFTLYNIIIGTFIAEEGKDTTLMHQLVLSLALALHFMGNDFALYTHHEQRYLKIGRWVLGLAVVAGFAFHHFMVIDPGWLTLALALVTGAVIMNSIKEELPEANKSSFLPFFAGVFLYAALLYTIK